MWSLDEIAAALGPSNVTGSGFEVPLWDATRRLGVGVNGSGGQVLILPGDSRVLSFDKKFASFSPWSNAYWVDEAQDLEKIAILTCEFDVSDESAMQAIAGVFKGLLEISERFGTAGQAVWSLKKLFEEGIIDADPKGVTGLIGELLVILSSPEKSKLIDAWHTTLDDSYDFSWGHHRLEVKTTRKSSREHNFSSFQIPGLSTCDVQVASVQIVGASVGISLGDLVTEILVNLDPARSSKVLDQCNKTLGTTPFSLVEPIFDLKSSLDSIMFFDQSAVPRPGLTPGVLEMKWKSTLEGSSPSPGVYPA